MLKQVLAAAPGAVATGVARQVVGDRVNPTQRSLPVSNLAWWMNGLTLALGLGAAYTGNKQRMGALEDFGQAVTTVGMAYTAQDATQEIRRRFATGTAAAVTTPTQVMRVQAPVRAAVANIPSMQYVGSEY